MTIKTKRPKTISVIVNCIGCILWLVIASVSAYDVYWSIKLSDTLCDNELNPMGVWLIDQDGGSVALFMAMKFLGTSIVLGVIPLAFLFKRWWGSTILASLAIFQCWVFYMLTFA